MSKVYSDTAEGEYLLIADMLSEARVRYSQEWQLARRKVATDQHATHIAIEQTKDEITQITARLKVAERRLYAEPTPEG